MQLDERIDEVVTRAEAGGGSTQGGGQLAGHDVPVQLLHEVERHAEQVGVLAHGEHSRHARAAL